MSLKIPSLSAHYYVLTAMLVVFVSTGLGYVFWEAGTTEITPLSIEGAPEGIVFISDPHLRPENLDHVKEVIQAINEIQPSVVLIGGDFVYEDGENLSLQEVWGEIDAPVYAVLGNHDYKSGISGFSALDKLAKARDADFSFGSYDTSCLFDNTTDIAYASALEEVLEENGVTVLKNECVELNVSGKTLLLVGVDDGWAGMADPPEVPVKDAFTIYLIHEPECRADWDADLILTGHRHGGQLNIPPMKFLNDKGVIELSGFVPGSDVPVYITRGIGTSNLAHEFRFRAAPEIVVINPVTDSLNG